MDWRSNWADAVRGLYSPQARGIADEHELIEDDLKPSGVFEGEQLVVRLAPLAERSAGEEDIASELASHQDILPEGGVNAVLAAIFEEEGA